MHGHQMTNACVLIEYGSHQPRHRYLIYIYIYDSAYKNIRILVEMILIS